MFPGADFWGNLPWVAAGIVTLFALAGAGLALLFGRAWRRLAG